MGKTKDFREMFVLEAESLDEPSRRMNVTIIRVGWSKNRRFYSEEVLRKAAPLFEGVKSFIDHDFFPIGRSVRDLAGFIRDVRFEEGRLRGVWQAADTEAGVTAWKALSFAMEHKRPDLAGLSIATRASVVYGKAEGREGSLVEEIKEVFSVDVVTDPAAGGEAEAVAESVKEVEDMTLEELLKELTMEKLQEHRPDLIDKIAEAVTAKVKEAIAPQPEQNQTQAKDQLTHEAIVARVYRSDQERVLVESLAGSDLPEVSQERIKVLARAVDFRDETGFLKEAEFKAHVKKLIEDEKAYLAQIVREDQVSVGNSAGTPKRKSRLDDIQESLYALAGLDDEDDEDDEGGED